jgi:hypothetical protein
MLQDEFAGRLPGFADGSEAPATRRFLKARAAAIVEPAG